METQRIPTSVYAEMTPNPAVMKFVADRTLVPQSHQLEFRTKAEAMTCSMHVPLDLCPGHGL